MVKVVFTPKDTGHFFETQVMGKKCLWAEGCGQKLLYAKGYRTFGIGSTGSSLKPNGTGQLDSNKLL